MEFHIKNPKLKIGMRMSKLKKSKKKVFGAVLAELIDEVYDVMGNKNSILLRRLFLY